MGFNFRKSIKIGPARINLSKSGVGYSIGAGGLRYTKSPKRKSANKKSAIKKTTTVKRTNATSGTKNSQREYSPVERSWTMAIILPIIAIIVVGGASFIVAFICYAIVSLFNPEIVGTLGSKFFVIGVPLLLAVGAALIAFFTWRPLPKLPADKNDECNIATSAIKNQPPKAYEVEDVEGHLDVILSMSTPNSLYSYKKQELIDGFHYDEEIYQKSINANKLTLTESIDGSGILDVLLDGKIVGHITGENGRYICDLMDRDMIESFTCKVYGGKYKRVNEDYDSTNDRSKYTMETGESPYGITVFIREKI